MVHSMLADYQEVSYLLHAHGPDWTPRIDANFSFFNLDSDVGRLVTNVEKYRRNQYHGKYSMRVSNASFKFLHRCKKKPTH